MTRSTATPTLKRCRESVEAALFEGAQHKIVLCPKPNKFEETRFESSTSDEYTAIVDDDDTIEPDALKLCYAAMKLHNLDLVFTDEVQHLVQHDKKYASRRGQRSFDDIHTSAQVIHHLVMMRSAAIDPYALELGVKFRTGVEWFFHASAALTGKVMHIPKVGYTWSRHGQQRSTEIMTTFNYHYSDMQKSIKERWNVNKGLIPQANIDELETFVQKNKW